MLLQCCSRFKGSKNIWWLKPLLYFAFKHVIIVSAFINTITTEDFHGQNPLNSGHFDEDCEMAKCHDNFWITRFCFLVSVCFSYPLRTKCTHRPARSFGSTLSFYPSCDVLLTPCHNAVLRWIGTDSQGNVKRFNIYIIFLLPQPAKWWEDVSLWDRTDWENGLEWQNK